MSSWFALLPNIVGIASDYISSKREEKMIKQKATQEILKAEAEARIKAIQSAQDHTQAWELKSLDQSGWKDEWFVVILSIPLVLSFVPWFVPYVQQGFAALDTTPEWYKWAVLTAIGSSFGIRVFQNIWKKNG